MTHSQPTTCLFLYGLQAKNSFYIIKWLNKNQKKNISWCEKLDEIQLYWHAVVVICLHVACDYFRACGRVEKFQQKVYDSRSVNYLLSGLFTESWLILVHMSLMIPKSLSTFNRIPF